MKIRHSWVWIVLILAIHFEPTLQSQTVQGQIQQAEKLYQEGRYAEAVVLCNRVLAGNPKDIEANYRRGMAYYRLQKYDLAIADLDRAISLDPKHSRSYSGRASVFYSLERYQEAIQSAETALKIDPNYASAYINRALCRRELKDARGAAADLDRALQIDPKNTTALINRGLLKSDAGDAAGAVADYDLALSIAPDNTIALLNRSGVQRRAGNLDGAIADASRLIELRAKDADAYNNRGIALLDKGDLEAARRDLDMALQLNPKHPQAQKNLARLEEQARRAAAQPVKAAPAGARPEANAPGASIPAPSPPGAGTPSLPEIEFRADQDPCAAKKKSTDGLPWKEPDRTPINLPPGVEPATLAPSLNLKTMSSMQYNGAVSTAMEGMRILYGALPEEEERKFQAAWAPLFDFPTQAAVDYLNRLNPLLGQFLAGRESFVRAAGAIQAAMYDAGLAVAADIRDGYFDALAMVERETEVLRSLEAALAGLAKQIQTLGNPPNPLAAKCEAQERYRRTLKDLTEPLSDNDFIGEWEGWMECLDMPEVQDTDLLLNEAKIPWLGVGKYRHVLIVDANTMDGRQVITFIQNIAPQLHKSTDGQYNEGLQTAANVTFGWPAQGWIAEGTPVISGDWMTIRFHVENAEYHNWRWIFRRVGDRMEAPPDGWTQEDIELLRKRLADFMKREDLPYSIANEKPGIQRRVSFIAREREENLRMREAFHRAAQEYLQQIPPAKRHWNDISTVEQLTWKHLAALPKETAAPAAKPSPAARPAGSTAEEQAAALEETITFHKSMIELLNRNLQKEVADMNQDDPKLSPAVREQRRREFEFRIIQLQSDIQAEQDLLASYQTGKIVHTRSAFDVMAHEQFVHQVQVEAQRADATRRIAVGIERQIELLPPENRAAMRAKAHSILDGKALGSNDVEKARRLAAVIHEQVQGHWQGEAARQEEKAIAAQENEFIANSIIMAAGTIVIGTGYAAYVEAYGETAALAAWMPHIIGGVYGGVTGTIAGGPVEGLKQTISWAAPIGFMAVSFVEGYNNEASNPKSGLGDRLWAGAKQAGAGYVMGKAMQFGTGLVTRGALAYFGPKSRLFQPINWSRPTVQQQFASAKYNQDVGDAKSLIKFFTEKRLGLMQAQQKNPAGSVAIQQAENELKQLAASLNSSYHCKWLLKYEAHPSVRRAFSQLVDQSYKEMNPDMMQRLKDQGYDMSNLRFEPLRNASSSGSSSMDLDLALKEPPGLVIRKNGQVVSLEQLQKDAQRALNESYHKVTGFSATRSELALTTSIHNEAFANKKMLKADVDFSKFTEKEMASIGKVVQVKADKIKGDPVLGDIAKLQAQCRESAKEIDNMMLRNLKQKLAKAKPGSPEHQQLQIDQNFWTDIQAKFKRISMETTNPYEMLEIDRSMRQLTGGKGCREVIHDLVKSF
jgi:tetratricopeptide (TPR) repeat protein